MYRVREHYLAYWSFLGDFATREEAEGFVQAREWLYPHREFHIDQIA